MYSSGEIYTGDNTFGESIVLFQLAERVGSRAVSLSRVELEVIEVCHVQILKMTSFQRSSNTYRATRWSKKKSSTRTNYRIKSIDGGKDYGRKNNRISGIDWLRWNSWCEAFLSFLRVRLGWSCVHNLRYHLYTGREEVWQILWYTMCNDARNLFEKRRGTSIKMPFAGIARRKCESVTFNWNTRYLTDEVW